jgi:hypothetical protein
MVRSRGLCTNVKEAAPPWSRPPGPEGEIEQGKAVCVSAGVVQHVRQCGRLGLRRRRRCERRLSVIVFADNVDSKCL